MFTELLTLFLLLFLGSVAGLLGGLIVLWKDQFAKKASIHLISFAAGVMLSVAFLDLLPEAIQEGGEGIFVFSLLALVAFFLAEDFLLHFHHHEGHEHSLKSVVPLVAISDSLHNFIDGVVISASFLSDPKLGLVVAIATFVHEIPQEIGDFGVLLAAGLSKTRVLLVNLASSAATFAGALLTLLFVGDSGGFVGPLLGLAAGMFLYISSADILPQLVRGNNKDVRWHIAGFFLLGILLVFFITRFE